jgi:preprotein translocase subunit SecY
MFNMFSGGAVSADGDLRAERDALHLGLDHRAAAGHHLSAVGKLRKEGGEAGRKQLNQYTRYLTVPLAMFQAVRHRRRPSNSQGIVVDHPGCSSSSRPSSP